MIKTDDGKYILDQEEYEDLIRCKLKVDQERERMRKYYEEKKELLCEKKRLHNQTDEGKEYKRNYMRTYMAQKRAAQRAQQIAI